MTKREKLVASGPNPVALDTPQVATSSPGAVNKDTVARRVKSTLANAGIDVTSFATHSTRAAWTSYSVNKAGFSLAQELKAAG